MPEFIAPQLCETRERPPSADGWIHEIKFDGYRIQMRIENGEVDAKNPQGVGLDRQVSGDRGFRRKPARCDH